MGPAPGQASAAAGSISAPHPAGREAGRGLLSQLPRSTRSPAAFGCRAGGLQGAEPGTPAGARSRQLGKGSFGFSGCQRLLFLSTALIWGLCPSLFPSGPWAAGSVQSTSGQCCWRVCVRSFWREAESCLGLRVVFALQPRWYSLILKKK